VEQVMRSAGLQVFVGDDQTTERDAPTELVGVLHAADEDSVQSEFTLTPSCETESSSTVAQESQPMELLTLPQGAEAFTDTAISDEEDVEQEIEDSLQDVFATLEAEVMAKRFSLPVIPLTSVVISQDSFSDEEEASPDLASKTARCEQETISHECSEAVSTDSMFPRIDSGETSGVAGERVTDKYSQQETADVDLYALSARPGVDESTEADALDQNRTESAENAEFDAVELVNSDASLEPALISDTRDETRMSGQPEQDDTALRETNRVALHTTQTSRDSSDVAKEAAECDTERISGTQIVHGTESRDAAAEINIEDYANKSVKAATPNDDELVSINTATDASQESYIRKIVEDKSCEVAAETETRCSDDGTEGGTAAEPTAQDAEEPSKNISGVTDHDEQPEDV